MLAAKVSEFCQKTKPGRVDTSVFSSMHLFLLMDYVSLVLRGFDLGWLPDKCSGSEQAL